MGDGGDQTAAVDPSMEPDDSGTPTGSMEPDGQETSTESKMYFRYNRNCMEFLQVQMAKANEGELACTFSKTLKFDSTAEDRESASSCKEAFEHALSLGKLLTSRHARPFDMEKFYSATEAREAAQAICKDLKLCMERWDVQGVEILGRVPQGPFEEDERTLDRYLGYILDADASLAIEGMPSSVQKEWEQAKKKLHEGLRRLKIIPDEEIGKPQRHFSDDVYMATYRGRDYAVKRGRRLDNVGFARFYTEAAVMEDIHSPAVARLYAVTRSGKLVMEKGEMDIMAWFCQHKSKGLKFKLELLRDAAESLHEVHHEGLVHRDIRTKKFVVFAAGQPEVKIVGFGKASNVSSFTGKNTVRKHGKITFAAPEIFDEKPCDMKSDIYSFGIVMYEMIGECTPYGASATDAAVVEMKRNGQVPVQIASEKCPDELLELMADCCAVDPADRPESMKEVQQRLAMFANLDDPQVASLQKLQAIVDEVGKLLPQINYSNKTLTFLFGYIKEAQNVHKFPETESMFPAWNELVKAIQQGKMLVLRHTEKFDLSNYYTVEETVFLVNDLCDSILNSINGLGACSSTGLQYSVPDDCSSADDNFLKQHIRFLVGVLDRDGVNDKRLIDEWTVIKSQLDEKVRDVKRVSAADVNWDQKEKIAAGSQGTVYSTRWNGKKVALKVLKSSRSPDCSHDQLATFWAETVANAKIEEKNPHIVRLLAMGSVACSDGADDTFFLVMELADENLRAWYRRQDVQDWSRTRNVLFQAGQGLQQLHKMGTVHRDVKPQNILVFHGGDGAPPIIKLCDLGVATGQSENWRRSTLKFQPGTEAYQAPELFHGKRSNEKSDIYSFGVVMIEAMSRREPTAYSGLAGLGRKAKGTLPCSIPDTCPKDLGHLIQRCLLPDPDARPTMEGVMAILSKSVDDA